MATTQTNGAHSTIDEMFDRASQAQEQLTVAARKVGTASLDSWEKAVDRAAELQVKLAAATQQEWVKNVASSQADLARELTRTYTSTARALLK